MSFYWNVHDQTLLPYFIYSHKTVLTCNFICCIHLHHGLHRHASLVEALEKQCEPPFTTTSWNVPDIYIITHFIIIIIIIIINVFHKKYLSHISELVS